MAPHEVKRRKLAHLSSSGSEVVGDSDNDSASSTNDGDVAVQKKHSMGMRQFTEGSTKLQSDGAFQVASSAYNSNTFKLQMDELLVRVRPKNGKRMIKVENVLRRLKSIIENIPSQEAVTIQEAGRKMNSHQIRIPFPEPRPDSSAKYTLAYTKPININVVGSYARKTTIQLEERLVIDLAVTMPSDIFQDKDFLNYRYFYKRAYYLACIAAGIQEANLSLPRQHYAARTPMDKLSISEGSNFVINFACQDDNFLQPIIHIDPELSDGVDDFAMSKYRIRIILAAKEDLFPALKTLPDKTCIRAKSGDTSSSKTPNLPTPMYNATLRSECLSLPYLKFLHAACVQSDTFQDACLLGSVWLRQRGYGGGLTNGGFGQFEWACVTALLMQSGGPKGRPVLSSGYSSCQLFKAVLQFLCTRDLVINPLFIQSSGLALVDNTKPIFFDGTRGHNILFKMTAGSSKMLRHDASNTLKALSQTTSDGFGSSFIAKIDSSLQRFDTVLNLSISPAWTPNFTTPDAIDKRQQFYQEVYDALLNGLGDRVTHIYLTSTKTNTWSTALESEFSADQSNLILGLLINSEQVYRTLDKGPSAEDKEAASSFRKFWGEKAELRRFKDGSILESLIWSSAGTEGNVVQQIIQYVIRRHIGPRVAESIRFLGDDFDHFLSRSIPGDPYSTSNYQPLMSAFETLEKELRNIEGLPLQIRQISAASPSLRYASLDLPVLTPKGSRMKPAEIYVQFEGSARWPDDIFAVQKTKIAFLLKIGELLEQSSTGLASRLGLENETHKFLNIAFLDIIHPSHAIFRLRIHHERELSLLQRLLKDKSYNQGQREQIAHAASAYKRDYIRRPLHTQAVRTLSTRFSLLSPSMRLLKQWRDSHLLSPHVTDELIELLTIRTFVHPYPWSAPGSVRTAFLRTLKYISNWDWRSEPLIVDCNGEITSKDVDAITTRFEAWRNIDPGMNRIVIFAASNVDPNGVTWTEQGPSKVVAARFTSLAKAACEVIKSQGLDVDGRALFIPSYVEYDFLVYLNPKFVRNGHGLGKKPPAFRNLELQSVDDDTIATFDPVQLFLDELCVIHGSHVVFFHDAHQGSVIAGLWNPQTGPRPWKVNVSYSTMPVGGSGEEAMISINKTGILNDIARLGGDLVLSVESMR